VAAMSSGGNNVAVVVMQDALTEAESSPAMLPSALPGGVACLSARRA
jgi:hypothetical protein